ncbi:MAG: glucosamine-6-phosphate deaminase [Oscillospiraceae bacterium]
MIIYRATDYEGMCRKAANIISAQVTLKPESVLGLATGSTPIGIYEQLVEKCTHGDLDFSNTRTVNLDEYKGMSGEDSHSYRYFMQQHLFGKININPTNVNIPNGLVSESDEECTRYNEVIRSLGGIDLQLLGLGHNGHIGFNEPGSEFVLDTHCVELTESTINANKRFFEDGKVPHFAYTMGIGNIMQSRMIVLVVNGESKAKAVRDSFFGPVTPGVPASVLQLHGNVIIVGDDEALSLIPSTK